MGVMELFVGNGWSRIFGWFEGFAGDLFVEPFEKGVYEGAQDSFGCGCPDDISQETYEA